MIILESIDKLPKNNSYVVTIGNFDGVHLGHVHLLKQLKTLAKAKSSKTVVMTFRPHPMVILNNVKERYLLTDIDERRCLIEKEGIDYLIEVAFTRDMSTLTPSDFLSNYIFNQSALTSILLGFNFSFGSKKSGTHEVVVDYVKKNNLKTEILKATGFSINDQIVSSSKIRNELEIGNVSGASEYLGRKFSISGVVVKGDGIGRTIGFPTANIRVEKERCIPRNGVYVTKTIVKKREYLSLTNIGFRPTFVNESPLKFETHILDFNDNIYGEEISISFYEVIRSEKKFSSVTDLVDQINQDKNFSLIFWSSKKKNN